MRVSGNAARHLGDTFMSGFLVSGLVGPFKIAVVPKIGEIGANWYMYPKGEKLAHIKNSGKTAEKLRRPSCTDVIMTHT